QQIAEQDMNSWERITPGAVATHDAGYAIYRATIRAPKIVQSRGGRIVFRSLNPDAEIYLDGRRIEKVDAVVLAPGNASSVLSVVIAGPGGLGGAVEVVANAS